MPIHRTSDGGWQWGHHGHVYYGRDGYDRALAQARAAYYHGYRGNPEDGTMHECPECGEPCDCFDGEEEELACTHCPIEEGGDWDDEDDEPDRESDDED